MASVLPNGLCTAQWPLYCPVASVLPNGLCTAQWPLYCPMASVLPNGLCTAQWPLYCPVASVLPNGLCTAQWPLYCPVMNLLYCLVYCLVPLCNAPWARLQTCLFTSSGRPWTTSCWGSSGPAPHSARSFARPCQTLWRWVLTVR
jgi:hypothetical protein